MYSFIYNTLPSPIYNLFLLFQLYECLLKIQEGDIRNSLLRNADEYTLEERNKNEQRVKEVLEPQHKLAEILSVHKGKVCMTAFCNFHGFVIVEGL